MNGNTPVKATVVLYGKNTAILNPTFPLTGSTTYYIVVNTGITDTSGSALSSTYGSSSTSEFTTAASTPPAVSAQYPASTATGIPIYVQPCVVFSKPMDPFTINSANVQLMTNGSQVQATVALYGKATAIITPASPLTLNTTYYIVVNTGVKDISGNSLSFTYGSPTASSFMPTTQ